MMIRLSHAKLLALAAIVLQLVPAEAAAPKLQEIVGTYIVAKVYSKKLGKLVTAAGRPTLILKAGKSFKATAGCNKLSGGFKHIEGKLLSFDDKILSTKRNCPGFDSTTEELLAKALAP